jgi:hypothetical protein
MDGTRLTKERFMEEVKNHKMKVLYDNGLYRHLHFSDGTFNMAFDVVTWPNHLAYTGDMGSFLFSRIEDMFNFFRRKDGEINPGYWSEKVLAESCFGGGIREFSVEEFRDCVLEEVMRSLDVEEKEDIPEDIMEEIYFLLHAEDEYECVTAMRDSSSTKVNLDDFWEHTVTRGTYHYIWCCYALVFAIGEYDKSKED